LAIPARDFNLIFPELHFANPRIKSRRGVYEASQFLACLASSCLAPCSAFGTAEVHFWEARFVCIGEKYGEKGVKKYYSKFDVAVVVQLT